MLKSVLLVAGLAVATPAFAQWGDPSANRIPGGGDGFISSRPNPVGGYDYSNGVSSRPNPAGGYDYSSGLSSRPNPVGGYDYSNGVSCRPNPVGGMDCRQN
jgi:hypothetical protein